MIQRYDYANPKTETIATLQGGIKVPCAHWLEENDDGPVVMHADYLAELAQVEAERDTAQDAATKNLAALNASLEELDTMTEDRNLWRDAHNEDCPNKAMVETLERELEEARRLAQLREDALCMIYEKWENGDPCFEACDGELFDESGSSLGNAVKLSYEEEEQILALIPKEHKPIAPPTEAARKDVV